MDRTTQQSETIRVAVMGSPSARTAVTVVKIGSSAEKIPTVLAGTRLIA